MRTFGPPADQQWEERVRQAATELYEAAPVKRPVYGADFVMDDPDEIVMYEVDLHLTEGERFRLAMTTPSARPPFEWLMEITSEIGQSEYIKHYLIRDQDIVLAQRKVLTPIDNEEAQALLADLAAARASLEFINPAD